MPIDLDDIRSGYNLSKINSNFQKIEDAWDEKLDRLVNDQGNQMEQQLDMNSNKIINHPPTDLEEPTDLVRVDALSEYGDFTGAIPVVASYVGNGVQTAFPKPVNANDARTFQVYIGGLRQEPYTDYFITDTSVVFQQAPVLDVSVDIYGYNPVLLENSAPVYADPILANFVGDGTTTTFFVSAAGSSTDAAFISIDGVNQTPFTDFTNAGGSIQFTEAPPLNSEIFVRIFAPFTNNATDSLVIADGSTEPRTLGDRFADTVNVKDFGAIPGQDINDALLAALQSGKTVVIDDAYISTSPFVLDQAGVYSVAATKEGSITSSVGAHSDGRMLSFGPLCDEVVIKGLTLKGSNDALRGMYFNCSHEVSDCDISDFYGDVAQNSSMGIEVEFTKTFTSIIKNNKINNINAHKGGSTGDASGSCRAIFLKYVDGVDGNRTVVHDNNLYDIIGREGDIIQITGSPLASGDYRSTTSIRNNDFGRSNRRHIKAFGSNISISNNRFYEILATDPDVTLGGGSISLAAGDGATNAYYNSIQNNEFYSGGGLSGLMFVTDNRSFSVTGNNIYLRTSTVTTPCLTLNNNLGGCVSGNTFRTSGIALVWRNTNTDVSVDRNWFRFEAESPRSCFEPSDVGINLNRVSFSYNSIILSSSVVAANSFLAIFVPFQDYTWDSFKMAYNTITPHTGSRAKFAWFNDRTLNGMRFANNYMEGTGAPFQENGGTSVGNCIFVNNDSDDVRDWQPA